MIELDELKIPDASPVLTKEKWNGLLQWVAEHPPNLTDDTLKLSTNKDATLKVAMAGLDEALVINPKKQFKNLAINGPLTITGKGGQNIDLVVNGRIQSTDKDGGLWVGRSRFVGGKGENLIGFYNNKAWRMVATDNGNVGIGTLKPLYRLSLGSKLGKTKLAIYQSDDGKSAYGLGVTAGKFYFNIGNPKARYVFLNQHGNSAKEIFGIDGAGNVKARSYGKSSDRRLKKEIRKLEYGLKEIQQMNPVNYTYNGLGDSIKNQKDIGFIAQELEKIAPYLVSKQKGKLNKSDKTETELLNIIPSNIIPILVNAVKELSQKIRTLEEKSIDDLIRS